MDPLLLSLCPNGLDFLDFVCLAPAKGVLGLGVAVSVCIDCCSNGLLGRYVPFKLWRLRGSLLIWFGLRVIHAVPCLDATIVGYDDTRHLA